MNKDNIKNKIMSLIKNDEVIIKSKWRFILHNYLKLMFVALLGLLAIYVVSLAAFISRIPPELLMLVVAIFIWLYILLVNQDKVNTMPRVYLWLLMASVVLIVAYILNLLHMHESMMRDRRVGSPMHDFYKHYKPESFTYEKLKI